MRPRVSTFEPAPPQIRLCYDERVFADAIHRAFFAVQSSGFEQSLRSAIPRLNNLSGTCI
ncbi:hypothetical protein CUJ89_34470 [Burkholderia pyrrocinia]|uniref:Uncharacterized protein n=1 Tax=Burkholderia pyrrocinia TaxID=60550 RepID=A0A2Z5N7J6_BURPY|nr:hypothetical protein CUJ89_34470 [Burkholderia pyrrocinia]